MASSSRALTGLVAPAVRFAGAQRTSVAARLLTTSSRPTLYKAPASRSGVSNKLQSVARQSRRQYADAAAAKKPRRFRTLRWIWRLTYLSAVGGVAYVGYGIYLDRHPEAQYEPDPSKKTLVILGELGRAARVCRMTWTE